MGTTEAILRLRQVLRRQHKALATEDRYVHWLRHNGPTWRGLFCCLLPGWLWVNPWPGAAAGAEPLKVIFDTDIDGDNDDVAAAAILHALADAGQVEILAMGVVSLHPYSPACLDATNTYYGRGTIPIGVYKGSKRALHGSSYAKIVAERCPNDIGPQVPDVLGVYRRVLSTQPDGKVTIIAVGQMNNLVDLLGSPPDERSNLPGCCLSWRRISTSGTSTSGPTTSPPRRTRPWNSSRTGPRRSNSARAIWATGISSAAA